MLPKYHIFIGLLASLLLFLIFPESYLEVSLFFFSSWLLIDMDHYLLFVLEKKSLSPKKFWNFSMKKHNYFFSLNKEEKKKYKKPIFIFHNLEFILILFLICLFFNILVWVLLGLLIHLITDWIYGIYKQSEIFHRISILYTLRKNRNRKKLNLKDF